MDLRGWLNPAESHPKVVLVRKPISTRSLTLGEQAPSLLSGGSKVMSDHCPCCEGRKTYVGEACPVCVPALPHDPDRPSGVAAIWGVAAIVVFILLLMA